MAATDHFEDPLKPVYHESFIDHPDHYSHLIKRDTALLCIDLQYLDAAEGYGVFRRDAHSPVSTEGREYYFKTLHGHVIPNVHILQNCFRRHGLEVIHVRIQSLTRYARIIEVHEAIEDIQKHVPKVRATF